jgi:hypothetical protein
MIGVQTQPAPVANKEPPVWPLVIECLESRWAHARDPSIVRLVVEDMRDRDRVGRERYGVPLQPHNGRDALIDAYHEALDCCAYTRQAIDEGEDMDSEYLAALSLVTRLRRKIDKRLPIKGDET